MLCSESEDRVYYGVKMLGTNNKFLHSVGALFGFKHLKTDTNKSLRKPPNMHEMHSRLSLTPTRGRVSSKQRSIFSGLQRCISGFVFPIKNMKGICTKVR